MPMCRPLLPAALLVAVASVAGAQECRPGEDSREARMLGFFAAPLAFSPSGHVARLRAGDVRLGFDLTYVPTPDEEIRRPERCYTNTKTENTNLSDVFPRPRLIVGLGGGVALEATYLPPITVMDATPNLFQVALGYNRPLGSGGTSVLLRGHATIGEVKGPITCSPEAIQTTSPTGTCYATTPSEDTYKPNMVGVEGALAFGGRSRLKTYLGVGVTALRPRFHVGFTDFVGNVDTTQVIVDLTRFSAFAGAAWSLTPRLGLTAEVYSQPEDVTTFRLGGQWTVRKSP